MLLKSIRFAVLVALLCLPAVAATKDPVPSDLMIFLERRNCEDGCPVYRVLIFANGDVIWHGYSRVARMGLVKSRITPEQVKSLIDNFMAIDYFQLGNFNDYYGPGCQSNMVGFQIVITSLSMGGQSKMVVHEQRCEGELFEKLKSLEDKIDGVVDTERWIAGKTPGVPRK